MRGMRKESESIERYEHTIMPAMQFLLGMYSLSQRILSPSTRVFIYDFDNYTLTSLDNLFPFEENEST